MNGEGSELSRLATRLDERGRERASRRTVIKAGAAAVGLSVVGFGGVAKAQSSTSATPSSSPIACVMTPELTEGPYYVEDMLIRKDITEGKAGLPLKLRIQVADTESCAALANAAVDVWHCDAQGYYSGISGENPGGGAATTDANLDTTFLRGIQMTGDNGIAEIDTVYPGWYMGRTVHIHMKVHFDGTTDDTYEGGHVSHTGQLFFDDAISDKVFETEAYAGRQNDQRLRNDGDNILGDHADEPGFMLDLKRINEDSLDDGFIGMITVGVDSTATPSGNSGGGGAGGPGGQGGPPPGDPGATATAESGA
ncbi:MAG: intradiol ring-cleavage dioxygenase [Thermomicrobiales bacterium]